MKFYKNRLAVLICFIMLFTSIGMVACKSANIEEDAGIVTYNVKYMEWSDSANNEIVDYSNGVITAVSSTYDEAIGQWSLVTFNIETEEKTSIPLEVEADEDNYISPITMGSNGDLMAILVKGSHTKEDYSDYTEKKFLVEIEDNGELTTIKELDGELSENSIYIQGMKADAEDHLFLTVNGDSESESKVIILDMEGNLVNDIAIGTWMDDIIATPGGDIYVSYWGTDGKIIRKIDATGNSVSETKITGYGTLHSADEEHMYSQEGNVLSLLNITDGTSTEVLNWMNSSIDGNNIRYVGALPDGRLMALCNDYENNKLDILLLSKADKSEKDERKELVYACMYMDDQAKKLILDFNKSNTEYRIVTKEYLSDDYEAAIAQFNNDITSGNMADIVDFSSGINPAVYASKGLLEDLYPYIDEDPDMERQDFVESVFKACEMNGKLYYLTNSFSIDTLVARGQDVGTTPGWTVDEMMEFIKKQPEDMQIFEYATKESVLYTCALNNMSSYVNWETGECSFDSKEFINILEFSNTFVAEEDYNYDYESSVSGPKLVESGELMFMTLYLSEPSSYQIYDQIYKGDMVPIGYPNSDGTNGAIFMSSGSQFAISSKSKHKDAAWEFVRTGLLEENVNMDNIYAFPINRNALNTLLDESMKDKENYSTWGWNDFEITAGPTTQEEVDEIRELIENTCSFSNYDNEINDIVNEETKPFFEGQKNAEEVASIIQSRVQIYVNENR